MDRPSLSPTPTMAAMPREEAELAMLRILMKTQEVVEEEEEEGGNWEGAR